MLRISFIRLVTLDLNCPTIAPTDPEINVGATRWVALLSSRLSGRGSLQPIYLQPNEPVPASEVNIVGRLAGDATILRKAKGSAAIRLERY